jgi:hypothetical protein
MASASVGSSRLCRAATVIIGLLAAGWISAPLAGLAPLVSLANAKDPPKQQAKSEEPKKSPAAPGNAFANSAQVRVINEQIAAQWKANGLTPSPRAPDAEFIRRVTLDIIGRIATPEEVRAFLDDNSPNKRAQLIDRLLASEDYAKNWANIWTVWLMTRSSNRLYQEQMQAWLEENFQKKNQGWNTIVYDLLTAAGENNQNGAVNFILQNLGMPNEPGHVGELGYFDFVPLTSRTTRLFLGLQLQCTQCHNHPFNNQWKQKDFWGINAFFRQLKRTGTPMMAQPQTMSGKLGLVDDMDVNREGGVFYEQRNAEYMYIKAVTLDGKKWTAKTGPRRPELAQSIIKSNYFPKAYVNRMWGHFFGRGFTTQGAVDDFGEHNPISHPMLPDDLVAKLKKLNGPMPEDLSKEVKKYEEDKDHPRLLDYLAQEFKQADFNPRDLIRWICNSDAYNLTSIANDTNKKADAEPFFSRMLLKAMTPDQLFESLMLATQAEAAETQAGKTKLRQEWMKNLIVNFGDDEGNEVTFNGTVVQALLLMNGKDINAAICNTEKGILSQRNWLKHGRTSGRFLEYLYLAALNRYPTSREREMIFARGKASNAGDAKNLWSSWQDLYWALLNSNEFILNH